MPTSSPYRTLPTLITLLSATLFGSAVRAQTPIPFTWNGQATIESWGGSLGGCGSPAQFWGPPPQGTGPGEYWIPSPSPTCSSGNCQTPNFSPAWPSQTVGPFYPSIPPLGRAVQGPPLQQRPIPYPTRETFPSRTDLRQGPSKEQNRNDRWTFDRPLGRVLRLFLPLHHRSQDCS